MSPTRWTWCSATAPATAARWPTRSRPFPRSAPESATCGLRPHPTPYGSAPPTWPMTTSTRWSRPSPEAVAHGERACLAHGRAVPRLRNWPDGRGQRAACAAGRMPPVRLRGGLGQHRRRDRRRLVTGAGERRGTRAERFAMPLARNVVKDLAVEHGACVRPVQLRRTEVDTGYVEQVCVPCGHTLASVCPPCAERAKYLRAVQCREGWHLEDEPVIEPHRPTGEQRARIIHPAETQPDRDPLAAQGLATTDLDERIGELDQQITDAGMRGTVLPARPRRHRSTRPRHDATPLPRRKVSNRTTGKTYTAPDGKIFRPPRFGTLPCPSYGRVTSDGTPVDSGAYDYPRAAREALPFDPLVDRVT